MVEHDVDPVVSDLDDSRLDAFAAATRSDAAGEMRKGCVEPVGRSNIGTGQQLGADPDTCGRRWRDGDGKDRRPTVTTAPPLTHHADGKKGAGCAQQRDHWQLHVVVGSVVGVGVAMVPVCSWVGRDRAVRRFDRSI